MATIAGMGEIEYEKIVAPYEFENRANLFVDNITDFSKAFPELQVVPSNQSVDTFNMNLLAIKKSAKSDKPNLYRLALLRGQEIDFDSLNAVSIFISIHGRTKGKVREFSNLTNKTANHYMGKLIETTEREFDGNEEDFKFFKGITYVFRG